MKDGYSICLNEWALDKDIKNELGLLLIISSLCAKGYCYATNTYFKELFDIPEETISRKIKKLEEKRYITVEYEKRGCEIIRRIIRLTKMSIDNYQKCQSTIDENVKGNNINNKNKNINNIYSKKTYGTYKRVKLTDQEYKKLEEEYGSDFIKEQIKCLDEYIETNNNKNKYSNYYLVLKKAIREEWFKNKIKKTPEWFDKDIDKIKATKEDEQYMQDLIKNI